MVTQRELLQQAYKIDTQINSKIEQIKSLRELAEKTTTALNGMPSGNGNRQEDAIVNMVDLQREMCDEVTKLVDIKREAWRAIKEVDNPDYRTVLELRYLSFLRWEEIAVIMGYSMRGIFRIHKEAINSMNDKTVQ